MSVFCLGEDCSGNYEFGRQGAGGCIWDESHGTGPCVNATVYCAEQEPFIGSFKWYIEIGEVMFDYTCIWTKGMSACPDGIYWRRADLSECESCQPEYVVLY